MTLKKQHYEILFFVFMAILVVVDIIMGFHLCKFSDYNIWAYFCEKDANEHQPDWDNGYYCIEDNYRLSSFFFTGFFIIILCSHYLLYGFYVQYVKK